MVVQCTIISVTYLYRSVTQLQCVLRQTTGVLHIIYYIELKSCLSVCIFSRHVDNYVISTWIDSGLGLWLVLVLSFMDFVFIDL